MANKFVMAGVMGWPVAHSRSPVIHNHWIRTLPPSPEPPPKRTAVGANKFAALEGTCAAESDKGPLEIHYVDISRVTGADDVWHYASLLIFPKDAPLVISCRNQWQSKGSATSSVKLVECGFNHNCATRLGHYALGDWYQRTINFTRGIDIILLHRLNHKFVSVGDYVASNAHYSYSSNS